MVRCSRCRTLKGPTAFYRDPRRRNGLTSECRPCRAAYKKMVRGGQVPRVLRLCDRCHNSQHGPACQGCECRCRPLLGLAGPFEHGDPTAPSLYDQHDQTGQEVPT